MGNYCMGPSSEKGVSGQLSIAVFHERYKQDRKQLGEGRAGHVYKCTERQTSKVFACKNISKATQSLIECRREVMILNKLKGSKNIIFLKDVFEDSKSLFLVQELCEGGELYDQIVDRSQTDYGRFTEAETATMMKQIIGAVEACHNKHQVTHRDLKPENFLLKNKDDITELRMIDFGLSRFYTPDERLRTRVGTVYYTAPEVWNENYDQSCDLWSAGVMMYVLLCSYPPFDGDTDKEILRAVCRGKYAFPSPEWDDVSTEAKGLIRKLLSKNPRRRPTATEALKDEWFRMVAEEEGEEFDADEGEEEEEEEEEGRDGYMTSSSAAMNADDLLKSMGSSLEGSSFIEDVADDYSGGLRGIQSPNSNGKGAYTYPTSPPPAPQDDSATAYANMIRNLNEEKRKSSFNNENGGGNNGNHVSPRLAPQTTSRPGFVMNSATASYTPTAATAATGRRTRETSSLANKPLTPETSPDKQVANEEDEWIPSGITEGVNSVTTSMGNAMGFY